MVHLTLHLAEVTELRLALTARLGEVRRRQRSAGQRGRTSAWLSEQRIMHLIAEIDKLGDERA